MSVVTCIVSTNGLPCPQPPDVVKPIGLCKQHSAEVAAALLPRILKDSLAYMAAAAADEEDGWADEIALADGAQARSVASVLGGPHRPVVYIVKNGDRVKIGTSQNIRMRMQNLSLRSNDVLCVLDGDRVLERAMHRRFFKDRVGSTEWFELGEDLSLFIKTRTVHAAAPEPKIEQRRPAPPRVPEAATRLLCFPDGSTVGAGQWPDLYRMFTVLDGGATKKELAQAARVSRDTAMRAIEEWTRHGVQERRDGRALRYYLPKEA